MQRQTLNFLSVFSRVVVMIVSFVFTGSRIMCDLLSELTRNGIATFDYLHIVLAIVHRRLYLVTSSSQLSFQIRVVSLLPPRIGREDISVSDGSISMQEIFDFRCLFFLVIFNYRSYSPVNGRSSTSDLRSAGRSCKL